MRKWFALLVSVLLLVTMIPMGSVSVVAAQASHEVDAATAVRRTNELVNALNGKYFTTTQTTCWDSKCDDCCNYYVVKKPWLKNATGFVPDSVDLLPEHFYSKTQCITSKAWSCAGFASYCLWYIYARNTSDSIGIVNVYTGKFNKDSMDASGVRTGDVIRVNDDSGGHSFVYISHNSSGVTVLDSNFWEDSKEHNLVKKHVISWDWHKDWRMAVTRGKNWTGDELHTYPEKPVLSVSDKNTTAKPVVFTWNKTDNTEHYDLRVYNYGDYNVGAPYGQFDIPASTTSASINLPAGKYAAYITAVASNGNETPSEWMAPIEVVSPPGKSTLTAMAGGMVTDGVTFAWTQAQNAVTYDLRVYHYGDYNVGAPYYEPGIGADTTSTVMKLPVGKYAAYITAVASNGSSTPSEWITFAVSEPSVNTNYPTNIQAYKMWEGNTSTRVFDAETLDSYLLEDTTFTILAFYVNDWVKAKCTLEGIERTMYIPMGGVIGEKTEPTEKCCKKDAVVYTRYTCESTSLTLPKNSKVLEIGKYKDYLTQICYQNNGTYYIGWVLNDDLLSNAICEHEYDTQIIQWATCSTEGIMSFTCVICGDNYTEAIPATGEHAYDDEYDADCNVCGDIREVPDEPVEIVYGDADGDGEITLMDATVLSQYLSGYEVTLDEDAADADGDGEITTLDVILLQQYTSDWDVVLG